MKLRRYCVTVMDSWTPTRTFWTFGGALKHAASNGVGAHLFVWSPDHNEWLRIQRIWLTNIHDR